MSESIIHYWYQALASPLGIELVCSDVDSMRSRLYSARTEAQDTDLEKVAICHSPFDPQRLWMVKK